MTTNESADLTPSAAGEATMYLHPESGEWVDAAETAFRTVSRPGAAAGLHRGRRLYLEVRGAIHQPLVTTEKGQVGEDAWEVQRGNRTIVRVPSAGKATPRRWRRPP